jgi:hypothetical protein
VIRIGIGKLPRLRFLVCAELGLKGTGQHSVHLTPASVSLLIPTCSVTFLFAAPGQLQISPGLQHACNFFAAYLRHGRPLESGSHSPPFIKLEMFTIRMARTSLSASPVRLASPSC